MNKLLTLALLALALGGCSSDSPLLEATIRVIVSTDASIGDDANAEINQVHILVTRQGASSGFTHDYGLTDSAGPNETRVTLPNSLLLHNGHHFTDTGEIILTPINITVTARKDTTDVIMRRAEDMVFDIDKPVVLYMPLCKQCAEPTPLTQPCATDETCVSGSCQPAGVDLSLQPVDDGTQPAESSECPTPADAGP